MGTALFHGPVGTGKPGTTPGFFARQTRHLCHSVLLSCWDLAADALRWGPWSLPPKDGEGFPEPPYLSLSTGGPQSLWEPPGEGAATVPEPPPHPGT